MNDKTIIVNLDEALFVPRIEKTLLEIIRSGKFSWPEGATCVTQECDGELLWWSAPIKVVSEARAQAELDIGLMPLLGLRNQVDADYYSVDEQDYVASDWEAAVVTFEQFVTRKGEGVM